MNWTSSAERATAFRTFSLVGAMTDAVAAIAGWSARAQQRRRLAELDDRLLRDIGLDRPAALREAEKPFWR